MKKIIILLNIIGCMIIGVAVADTINVNWMVGNTVYDTTTCTIGGDLNVPITAPTKRGHIFRGWEAYTRLEYIESTGSQFIDTGYAWGTTNRKVEGKFNFSVGNYNSHIFGSTSSSDSWDLNPWCLQGVSYDTYIGNGMYNNVSLSTGVDYILTYDLNNRVLYTDSNGITQSSSVPYVPTSDASVYLLHVHLLSNHEPYNPSAAKVWYFKMWDNGVLVRDFVPVRRGDGAIGMYDKVTNTFFGNSGTGAFIAGPAL